MKLLLLGGPVFVGRQLLEAARARGHEVTTFNRGRTVAAPWPGVEALVGDRDGGLDALDGRRWDVAIDTSGYLPRVVADSARRLRDAVEHYTFVSSISVYREPLRRGADERHAVAALPKGADRETVTGESYGPLKALSEAEVEAALPGRCAIVRPGLIVGPHDTTDRFPYWPRRIARGGEVLAPGHPAAPVQFVDARDLAAFVLGLAERRVAGTFNVTGPTGECSMRTLLEIAVDALDSDARLTWVDEAFLLEQKVGPWIEMPLWLPKSETAIATVYSGRALAEGLTHRPVDAIVRDTFEWDRDTPVAARPQKPGLPAKPSLSAEREAELLAAWAARPR